MRRLLRWTLPLTLAIATGIVFASGLWMALRGNAGTPVGAQTATQPAVEAPDPSRARSILILGDSLARGTGDVSGRGIGGNLTEIVETEGGDPPEIVNVAVNGSRTADLLEKLDRPSIRQLVARTDLVVVSIGGNDLFGLSVEPEGSFAPPEGDARGTFAPVLARVEGAVEAIHEVNPEARIFLIGLYDPFRQRGFEAGPYVASWNAALLEAFGGDDRITVVQTADLFVGRDRLSADRFHPNDEAYRIIARRIADAAAL